MATVCFILLTCFSNNTKTSCAIDINQVGTITSYMHGEHKVQVSNLRGLNELVAETPEQIVAKINSCKRK